MVTIMIRDWMGWLGTILGIGVITKMSQNESINVNWKWVAVIAVGAVGSLIAFELVTIKSGISRMEVMQIESVRNEGNLRTEFLTKFSGLNETVSKLCQKVDDHIEHTKPLLNNLNGNGRK